MLKIQNLCKNFGRAQVLHDVSLHINKPLVYGLIGPNGAGKTTLMRLIVEFCLLVAALSVLLMDLRNIQLPICLIP